MDAKDTKTASDTKTTASTARAATPSVTVDPAEEAAVYIDHRAGKAKGKKRKYSAELRETQEVMRPVNKAVERVAQAVANGLTQWRTLSDRSAEKKRDGALKDAPKNAAKAAQKVIRRSSGVGLDVAKALRATRLYRQLVRGLVR